MSLQKLLRGRSVAEAHWTALHTATHYATVNPESECGTISKSAPIVLILKSELDDSDFEIICSDAHRTIFKANIAQ